MLIKVDSCRSDALNNMNRAEKRRQKKLAKKTARAAKTAHAPPSPTSQPSPTTQQELDLAIQHHSSGRLAEAEGIYRHILKSEPDQPVAMHYLGVAAHQTGKNEEAIELILRALSVNRITPKRTTILEISTKKPIDLQKPVPASKRRSH